MESASAPVLDFDAAPTLVMPGMDTKEVPASQKEPEKAVPVMDESALTDEERKAVEEFADKIELSNSNLILQYGGNTEKKLRIFQKAH